MEVASLQTVIVCQMITSSWCWGTALSTDKLVELLVGQVPEYQGMHVRISQKPDYFQSNYGTITLDQHVQTLVNYGLAERQAGGGSRRQENTEPALGFSNNLPSSKPHQPELMFPDLLLPTRVAIYRFLELISWLVQEAGDIQAQHAAVLGRLSTGKWENSNTPIPK